MQLQRGKTLIKQLDQEHRLTESEYEELLDCRFGDTKNAAVDKEPDIGSSLDQDLFARAGTWQQRIFGRKIYARGLIEFTNYCKNNCYYCGIRRENRRLERYRLTKDQILNCCQEGRTLGYRTFVLQGGEDPFLTDEWICDVVHDIRTRCPDCAVTLSIGERSYESYLRYYEAGAERYLLRHETADSVHYQRLHPHEMSYDHRRQCLEDLKRIGYQVGAGFMVGSPGQSLHCLAEDLAYIQELKPHMVGIGPFISHSETPFSMEKNGSVEQTLFLIGILRLMNPKLLIPATTALGTLAVDGRERGILSGANVIMPNLSPVAVRKQYSLYDNKICTGEESAQCTQCIQGRMQRIGYEIVTDRGDYPDWVVSNK